MDIIHFKIILFINMFSRYTEQFKRNKQEYHKLVSNKQEEQIYLKEYV